MYSAYPAVSALAACVVLGMLVFLLFRRRQIKARNSVCRPQFELIEALRLGAHGSLYLVHCAGRTLLVSADARGIGAIQCIEEMPLAHAPEMP
jgi:hypothetical protein